jgi:hypothetical protein
MIVRRKRAVRADGRVEHTGHLVRKGRNESNEGKEGTKVPKERNGEFLDITKQS